MKALMKTAPGVGNFEIRDIPVPQVEKGDDVLIRVLAAGVCGTDIHIFHDKFKSYPPVVLGHEFSGVVEAVGRDVTRFHVGDRVVGEPHTKFCGVCDECRAGKIQLCAKKRSPGWGINGAFTDYLVMPELFLHHIPDNVSNDIAALAEPMAIVTHSVLERAHVEPQDTVAVIGAGPIGLLSAVVAKAGGAARVILLGRNSAEKCRFAVAQKLGVEHTINVMREDAAARIAELTNGRGVDLVIEASGSESGVGTAFNIVRKCGRLCIIGLPSADAISVPWSTLVKKSADVFCCMSSSVSSWERALSIMSHTELDLSTLISHHSNISDWESVFADIASGDAIKALFVPNTKGR